jgi:hypothetical protein
MGMNIRGITEYRGEGIVKNKQGQCIWCRCGGMFKYSGGDYPVIDVIERGDRLTCDTCSKQIAVLEHNDLTIRVQE